MFILIQTNKLKKKQKQKTIKMNFKQASYESQSESFHIINNKLKSNRLCSTKIERTSSSSSSSNSGMIMIDISSTPLTERQRARKLIDIKVYFKIIFYFFLFNCTLYLHLDLQTLSTSRFKSGICVHTIIIIGGLKQIQI